MTATVAGLLADLLRDIGTACSKCWREDHPPAGALGRMDDYKLDLGQVIRRENEIMDLAMECGYDGTRNDLFRAAHREAYALWGRNADLARMLRHVTPDADAGRLHDHGGHRRAPARQPVDRPQVGRRRQLAPQGKPPEKVLDGRRPGVLRQAPQPWPAAARPAARRKHADPA